LNFRDCMANVQTGKEVNTLRVKKPTESGTDNANEGTV